MKKTSNLSNSYIYIYIYIYNIFFLLQLWFCRDDFYLYFRINQDRFAIAKITSPLIRVHFLYFERLADH